MDIFSHHIWWYDIIRHPSAKKLIKYAKPQKTDIVLDIGGGTGVIAEALKPFVKTISVLDQSAEMLKYAKKRGVRTILGSANSIPFRPRTVDMIVCTDAFHHMQDQLTILREMRRVLKPYGRLIIEEIDPGTVNGKIVKCVEWILGCNSKFHRPKNLVRLLKKCGFTTKIIDKDAGSYLVRATPRI